MGNGYVFWISTRLSAWGFCTLLLLFGFTIARRPVSVAQLSPFSFPYALLLSLTHFESASPTLSLSPFHLALSRFPLSSCSLSFSSPCSLLSSQIPLFLLVTSLLFLLTPLSFSLNLALSLSSLFLLLRPLRWASELPAPHARLWRLAPFLRPHRPESRGPPGTGRGRRRGRGEQRGGEQPQYLALRPPSVALPAPHPPRRPHGHPQDPRHHAGDLRLGVSLPVGERRPGLGLASVII